MNKWFVYICIVVALSSATVGCSNNRHGRPDPKPLKVTCWNYDGVISRLEYVQHVVLIAGYPEENIYQKCLVESDKNEAPRKE